MTTDATKRLLRVFEKRNATSFIGALSKFETYFGHLWGHGKNRDTLTPEETAWREVWEMCRTEVLNNGNSQTRAVQAEVLLYKVENRNS